MWAVTAYVLTVTCAVWAVTDAVWAIIASVWADGEPRLRKKTKNGEQRIRKKQRSIKRKRENLYPVSETSFPGLKIKKKFP